MSDYTLRLWKPEDRPQLKELWKVAFCDGDEYIDSFFSFRAFVFSPTAKTC